MDRRALLKLLGGAAAAALYVPERSYFFGPWLPSVRQVDPMAVYPQWRGVDADLVTVTETWTSGRVQFDLRATNRTAVMNQLEAEHPGWVWRSQYSIIELAEQVVIHRPQQRDYVSFLVEDLADLSDAGLRQAYTNKVMYSFARRDKLMLDLAHAGLSRKQQERVLRRMERRRGPVAHAIRHGERVRFWTPDRSAA